MRIKNKIYLLASLISISVFAQNSNLIAKWNFNGNANDSSGNPNNLTVYNASLTKDRFNNDNSAYYFSGTNAYLETLVYNLPCCNLPRTITGWFKCDFTVLGIYQSSSFTLFDYGNISDFQRLSLSLYQKGYLQLTYSANVPTTYDSSLAYNDQKWHFFAITYDGSKLKTFIDNKIIFDNNVALNTLPNNNLFDIGKQIDDKNYFRGSIDDFAIYNKLPRGRAPKY
ncbi:LamG-like jellyroll fold domain-containing protein [Cloacibacterium sp.]|uniref:LamG-like jellyroll fold domain-containing protein n=1 Tax=Cloacibacterium sp. TaxID=1913682 RepID=UPI0035B31763